MKGPEMKGKTTAEPEKAGGLCSIARGPLARTVQFWGVILFAVAVLCLFLWSVNRTTPNPELPGSRTEAEHADRTP